MTVVEVEEFTSKSIHGHGPDGAACRYLGRASVSKNKENKKDRTYGGAGTAGGIAVLPSSMF
jgi:hypothetical protein